MTYKRTGRNNWRASRRKILRAIQFHLLGVKIPQHTIGNTFNYINDYRMVHFMYRASWKGV